MTSAESIYKALAFQYKPVEKHLLKIIKGTPAEKMYKEADYAKKIKMLDWHANNMGLN